MANHLTHQEAECLHYIEHCGLDHITTSDLGMKFGWSTAHAGTIVKKLFDANLVQRRHVDMGRWSHYEYWTGDGQD